MGKLGILLDIGLAFWWTSDCKYAVSLPSIVVVASIAGTTGVAAVAKWQELTRPGDAGVYAFVRLGY